ncbi:MAG: hypothetical protein HY823_06995 [Acidobacteria bacterium]|nr:hypothetical protein [Acidobacteriota bacterium]
MADTKKVLIWVGAGCGVVLLVVIATCGGLAYFGKKKFDQAAAELKSNPVGQAMLERAGKEGAKGGVMAFGGQMVAAGVSMYGATLLMVLPKEEQAGHSAVLEKLVKVGTQLTEKDVEDLNKALELQNTKKEGLPTPAEARTFFAQIKDVADRH